MYVSSFFLSNATARPLSKPLSRPSSPAKCWCQTFGSSFAASTSGSMHLPVFWFHTRPPAVQSSCASTSAFRRTAVAVLAMASSFMTSIAPLTLVSSAAFCLRSSTLRAAKAASRLPSRSITVALMTRLPSAVAPAKATCTFSFIVSMSFEDDLSALLMSAVVSIASLLVATPPLMASADVLIVSTRLERPCTVPWSATFMPLSSVCDDW
mmetsp:Transcript_20881/g.18504  ORF Transcript_20881/g.18504 Transcript_20881/m.18504 type:complete len:210 (-) Transcript_20881:96-725(-)